MGTSHAYHLCGHTTSGYIDSMGTDHLWRQNTTHEDVPPMGSSQVLGTHLWGQNTTYGVITHIRTYVLVRHTMHTTWDILTIGEYHLWGQTTYGDIPTMGTSHAYHLWGHPIYGDTQCIPPMGACHAYNMST